MPNERSARLFIVDNHPIARRGLRAMLVASRFRVVGEAGSGEDALAKISGDEVDLAIIDISMGEMDGIELTRRLKQNSPAGRVLILSMHDETYYVKEALKAGADGYVLKENVTTNLVDAVEQILAGRPYICGDMKAKLEA